MSEGFKLEGFEELQRKLKRLPQAVGIKTVRSAMMSAALPVVKEAKATVPVGKKAHKTHKGRLVAPGFSSRSVVRRSKVARDRSSVSVSVGVKSEAFYAVQFLELGTRHAPKQPWLVKAFENQKKNVIARYRATLKRKLEQEAKRK